MKNIFFFLLILFSNVLVGQSDFVSSQYYIDSNNGDDNNNGIEINYPWKTFENLKLLKLYPGDNILLKSGSVFNDNLEFNDSGSLNNPIVMTSFGKGDKPIINGNGKESFTVMLRNVEYWELDGFEITNNGKARKEKRTGLTILAEDSGVLHNIIIKNLVVRDVNGSLIKQDGGGSGILIRKSDINIPSKFDGLHIINCHIYNTERNAINFRAAPNREGWFPNLNIIIRNNLIEKVPGDGIVIVGCDGALVEYNTLRDFPDILPHSEPAAGIWPWSSDNTLVQFNEVSGHRAKRDGQGYDSDWNSNGTIIQNNYSHDNYGGFLLICNSGKSYNTKINIGTKNTIIRNNISVNDGIRPYLTELKGVFSPIFHITGPVEGSYIYNNIIILPKREANIDKTLIRIDNWGGPWPINTLFENNIFYFEDDFGIELNGVKDIYFNNNEFSYKIKNFNIDYNENKTGITKEFVLKKIINKMNFGSTQVK
tara:strand:+ start:510 stop:1955 length:1446 start_codon:yes stop_codon:yes gene_type:complete